MLEDDTAFHASAISRNQARNPAVEMSISFGLSESRKQIYLRGVPCRSRSSSRYPRYEIPVVSVYKI